MRLSISHDTAYHYDDQVRASIQYLRLTPRESLRQHVLDWHLDLPRPASRQLDPYGNVLHVMTLDEPHNRICIHATGHVEIDMGCESEPGSGSPLPFLRSTPLTQADEALAHFARQHVGEQADRGALIDLMMALREQMSNGPLTPPASSTAAEAFAGRSGINRDHSHAFIACARSLGVPARYVSGYLFRDDAGPLSSHDWTEAWLDGAWYSFDVTCGLTRPERHLTLAVGLDYLDACPVRGMRRGGGYEHLHAQLLAESSAPEAPPVQRQAQ